jgi:hypothetical protein
MEASSLWIMLGFFTQENGDLEKATPEKLRLEEKQRLARRTRKEQGLEWQDMWFGQVFHSFITRSYIWPPACQAA